MSDLKRIKSIFSEALGKEDQERKAYLDRVCSGDSALRTQIEALLNSADKAGDFLESPLWGEHTNREDTPITEAPGTIIGRYKLLEKIGEGGMAVVYMAEQQRPIRRKVALKIIKPGMDTKSVIARFETERQALAIMDHPHIARVYDAGATDTGRPYFVMELVYGVAITDYCDQEKLSTQKRLELFLLVCDAVQHAHQRGIIHRDLKPSNIMVTLHDDVAVPKVIDFGIAKATNQRLTEKTVFTRYAHMIGTPAYMSPEQAQMSDLDIDTRSDIYSLGVLLYELLTGAAPFGDEELLEAGYLEMQRIIREEDPPRPSTKLSTQGDTLTDIARQRCATPELLCKTIRGDLDWIVMKSLEKKRIRRYETASAFKRDVQRYLQHEPVHARRPSVSYRLQKYLVRNRARVITALVVAVFAGTVITLAFATSDTLRRRGDLREQLDRDTLYRVRASLVNGDSEGAEQGVQSILDSPYVGSEARLLHANMLMNTAQDQRAIDALEGLLEESPKIAGAAYSLLAQVRWGNLVFGDVEGGKLIKDYQQSADELLPDSAEACYLRALTAFPIKEKRRWLAEALKRDRWHDEACRLRALIDQASRRYKDLKLDAFALTELGEYEQALAAFDEAIHCPSLEDNEVAELYAQRCDVLMRMGEIPDLVAEARACLQKVPVDTEPIRFRAQLQFQVFFGLTVLGQYEEAGALFTRIVGARNLWVTTRVTRQDPWVAPLNLGPTINASNWTQSASLPADRSVLYFVSDRDGGLGGWDIWEVPLEGGSPDP